jgi:hypothetical protein
VRRSTLNDHSTIQHSQSLIISRGKTLVEIQHHPTTATTPAPHILNSPIFITFFPNLLSNPHGRNYTMWSDRLLRLSRKL